MIAALLVSAGVTVGMGAASGAQPDPDGGDLAPDEIRAAVDDVLSRPAYGGEARGPFSFLTDNPVTRWLADQWRRFVAWLTGLFPNPNLSGTGPATLASRARNSFAVVLLVGLAVLAAFLAVRLSRRREKVGTGQDATRDPQRHTPAALRQEADRAEASGDHESAVRLRFEAGLLELDGRGVIDYEESLPLGEVRTAVASVAFDTVATGFERVTYSDARAGPPDSDLSRRGWSEILDDVNRLPRDD